MIKNQQKMQKLQKQQIIRQKTDNIGVKTLNFLHFLSNYLHKVGKNWVFFIKHYKKHYIAVLQMVNNQVVKKWENSKHYINLTLNSLKIIELMHNVMFLGGGRSAQKCNLQIFKISKKILKKTQKTPNYMIYIYLYVMFYVIFM